ncbi:MAG: AsnC family transcriptional regulator [Candidatus Nanohalarchaeota archaeon]|nr:MAG: AsnC family transcriptional regulator [Candidatus Nanohaloarchaeota archaeon]
MEKDKTIDKTDRKILNMLLENAGLSCRRIAKKTGLSTVTILNRIKKLEDEKIIKNRTVQLDYQKLGYDVEVIIKLRISKGNLFKVEKKIAKEPNVSALYDVTGNFDTIIIAKFRNRKSMDNFLKKIQTYDFIERTETIIVLNTIKEENILIN